MIYFQKVGEECGGPWNAYGKCGFELTCLKDARECPYLFSPTGSTNTNICDEYLFNGKYFMYSKSLITTDK